MNTASRATAAGKLIFSVFAALAQFESDQISERTIAGQKIARERGVRFGRKTFKELYIDTGKVDAYQKLRFETVPSKTARAQLGIKDPTFRKYRDIFEPSVPIDDIGDNVQ